MLPSLLVGGNPSGYIIPNSLRFQSASSQYLSRTPSVTGSATTLTWSAWVKRGTLGTNQGLIASGVFSTANDLTVAYFNTSDNLVIQQNTGASLTLNKVTTQVFRDPSAWYHIVVVFNTTTATAEDRVQLYINNVRVTAWSTNTIFAQNSNTYFNQTTYANRIGRDWTTSYLDGYIAEQNFIDGQALTPSSFGETNTLTGQWVAKKYTGTYGTNGFYLPFSNGTSTTTLGADSSGNGNNWTLTNFTRSAGVSDCWMYDVPSGNGGASATQPNSNYAVLNPLWKGSQETIANGNLNVTSSGTGGSALSTIQMPSGKWYCETTINTGSDATIVGICDSTFLPTSTLTSSNSVGYYPNGTKFVNGTNTAYGATYTTGDVIGIALDVDAGTLTFYKNNVSQGAITHGLTGSFLFATSDVSSTSNINQSWNFGQRSFAYTPPSGFKALCTANLPASTIVKGNQYMDATLYTGNGTGQSIVNTAGFSPDLVWLKKRGGGVSAQWHMLADTIRGTGATLSSNVTDAEYTGKTSVTAFNSNGFTLGADSTGASYYGWNIASDTYVSWQWDAGSSTVTNTNGTISSQVRANPTAGVSVVTYTGIAGNVARTFGHGLGVAPKMVIVKGRNAGSTGTDSWEVYHASLGASAFLELDKTAASASATNRWGGTTPTSTVVTVGGDASNVNNESTVNYVAYCFAAIPSFSAFGSYAGNGSSDGNFLYFGFKPKFIMIKNITTSGYGGWVMLDTSRNPYNVTNKGLAAESSGAEFTVAYGDVLSNGFKIRIVDNGVNASGQSYIYAAFAENPFSNSNGA